MPEFDQKRENSTVRPNLTGLKASCYFVCLLALLLSVSPKRISCLGLFLLLLFAPLSAARWLQKGKPKEKAFLFLSVCSAVGVLAGGPGLSCFICFCLSLLFWSVYLCRCVFVGMPLRWSCHTVLLALFSDPGSYFTDLLRDWEARRERLTKYAYSFYLLAAVFTGLVLLLAQANNHFPIIFQTCCILILKKVPLFSACFLLALFPASFIYGFLKELKTGEGDTYVLGKPKTAACNIPNIPWGLLILLVTAANWSLLIVELYYTVYLKDAPLPESYRFYDIFVILLMLFISYAALCFAVFSTAQPQKKPAVLTCVSLGVSSVGLVILVCWRLGMYIYYHGLWRDRIIFCFYILLAIPLSLQIFIDCGTGTLIRRVSCTFIIVLAIAMTCPRGLFLTEVNTQIFIHKYHTQQLFAQRAGDLNTPTLLSSEDLRMDLVVGYGIEAIPALTWLVKIEDVTYQGQILGEYARSAILDCLCEDLNLTRTGDDTKDLASVYFAYADIPRYRLPTRYALALQYVDNVKDSFS